MQYYKTISSPIGNITLVATDEALIALYMQNEDKPQILGAMKKDKQNILLMAEKQLKEYFSGTRKKFDLPLNPEGTDFQNRAWRALQKIPYGEVWSYGKQANYLKKPNAQRAVGGANGKNPIPVIIPCHRVIGASGKLTGFSGGMDMKVFLLKLEGHEIESHGLKLLS